MPRVEHLPRQAGHDLDGVRAADAHRARAEPARVRRVRVRADDERARESVVLEDDLVNDAGARAPEAGAILCSGRLQKVVDLLVLGERFAEVALALDARLDEVVAVDRRRHRHRLAPRLAELQHRRLPEHVLQDDAVGTQEEIAASRLHLLVLRIVEVAQQDLVGESQRVTEPSAYDDEVALHRLVNLGGHLGRGLDRDHLLPLLMLRWAGGMCCLLIRAARRRCARRV